MTDDLIQRGDAIAKIKERASGKSSSGLVLTVDAAIDALAALPRSSSQRSKERVMSDEELIARLRLYGSKFHHELGHNDAADRIKALTEQLAAAQQDADEAEAYAEELEKERDEARAAWEIEAATVRRFAERHTRHLVMGAEARDGAERAEAKLAKAVEVLEALIQLAHDCEKKLTEDLHHMDFCGESEPLTKARTTLAEIKGESHE